MSEDPYQVLGVSRNASQDDIRKAYRKQSRENHPDVKPDDKAAAERFKQVQDAYSILGETEKRQKYDRFGHAAFQGGGGGFQGSPVDLGDLFGGGVDLGDLFGGGGFGGGRRSRPQKGRDVETSIEIPFNTAAEGGSYGLSLNINGSTEHLTIRIPAGIETGKTIRLGGQGSPGVGGGPNGDVLVKIRVSPHPYFRREGSNLLVDVPISITEAALGAKVDVPTLNEDLVSLAVPPGASSGTKLRLRGKGVPDSRTGERGDQFVVLKIIAPKNLADQSRVLLQQLAELDDTDPRDGLW